MPFTTPEKKRLVDGSGLTENSLYVALGIAGVELSGNNYSRGHSPAANNTSDNNGVVTIAAGQEIYTPNTNSAQDSTQMRIYRTLAGGDSDAVTDWVDHNDIPAPVNGQRVNTGTITITP